jgi:hypothetical protein
MQFEAEIHHPTQSWAAETPTISSNVGRKHVLKYLKRQKKMCKKLAELQDDEK